MISQGHIGKTETVRIIRHLPAGLQVELDDGRRGRIREREITWDADVLRSWRSEFPVGERFAAVVIGSDLKNPELSLRLVERDPWKNVSRVYPTGTLVNGIVTGPQEHKVFVELEPGITGVLPQTQLPAWVSQPISEVFWIGDRVRALVEAIDYGQREIKLTMQGLDKRRWLGANENVSLQKPAQVADSSEQDVSASSRELLPIELIASGLTRSFLVAEDDPEGNRALSNWLRSAGHFMLSALTGADALAQFEAHYPEIILLDVGMPDTDGITVVRRILDRHTGAACILMTDWSTAELRSEEIRTLESAGVKLLLKPILAEDLVGVLNHSWGSAKPHDKDPLNDSTELMQERQQLPHASAVRNTIGNRLQSLIDELRSFTRASRVILFILDPYQRKIEVASASGKGSLARSALLGLIHSPVRDAAEDGKVVAIEDTKDWEDYARYLLPLFPFRSCVGVPVPADVEQRYALFLFHTHPGFTGAVVEKSAQAGALAVATLLEQRELLQSMAELQKISLTGHAARAMIHETNYQLGSLVFLLSDLQAQWQRLCRAIEKPERAALPTEVFDTEQLMVKTDKRVENLVKTTRMFGRLIVQDDLHFIRIERTVERCIELLRDMGDRAHVYLDFEPLERMHITRAKETNLQQILLNLLINAIQQIERSRGAIGGRVRVRVLSSDSLATLKARILVEDDGPGIHQRQWERIFAPGVTTRKDEGSGMGLYIARRLCTEMGGQLFVTESALGWGTTFCVELPVRF